MNAPLRIQGVTFQVRVSDYEEGRHWYGKLLGRPPDLLPHEGFQDQAGFCEWELMPGSGCWLQVAEGVPAANSEPIRFGVVDIGLQVERLSQELDLGQPVIGTTPDGQVKFCTFKDPFGNRVGFYEEQRGVARGRAISWTAAPRIGLGAHIRSFPPGRLRSTLAKGL